jgi:hypothetical protein
MSPSRLMAMLCPLPQETWTAPYLGSVRSVRNLSRFSGRSIYAWDMWCIYIYIQQYIYIYTAIYIYILGIQHFGALPISVLSEADLIPCHFPKRPLQQDPFPIAFARWTLAQHQHEQLGEVELFASWTWFVAELPMFGIYIYNYIYNW